MTPAHVLAACGFLSAPHALAAQYTTYSPLDDRRVRLSAPAYADAPLTGRVLAFAGAAVGLVIGAPIGAPIGALVGAVVAPELWREQDILPLTARDDGIYRLSVDPRTDVRLATRASPSVFTRGEVALVAGDTLFLVPRDSRGARSVTLSDLALLQVRGGKDHPRGVAYGAAAFALVTAVAGGIDHAHGAISAGDVLASVVGNALIGGLVGYAFAPTGWESVALPRR